MRMDSDARSALTARAQRLADLHATQRPLVLPTVWDAWSARTAVNAGFAALTIGSHPLADPCFVLPQWLRHATRHGATVAAGSVVSAGSWCGLLHAEAGDTVRVAFDGIGDARVTL